jgi:DNA-binding beta-propeller fold protein YncE
MRGLLLFAAVAALACCTGCDSNGAGGEVLDSWGSPGSEAKRFVKPRGLAVDVARDAVYVVDMSGRLQKFNLAGEFRGSVLLPDSERGTGEGMTIGTGGELLVADTHYHRVLRYNSKLDHLGTFGARGTGAAQMLFPTCVALDAKGNIYVASYGDNRVHKFDSRYRHLLSWGSLGPKPGQFQRPSGLAIDKAGNVLVADAANHRIQRFTPQGKLLDSWGSKGTAPGELHYPYDLAVLPDGSVVVAENYNNRLQRFSIEGQPLGCFGGPGRERGSFARPWCLVAVADGRVFVADSLNHRVQVVRFDATASAASPARHAALSTGEAR